VSSDTREIAIPADVLLKWQRIVDLLANIMHVPSAVVTEVEPQDCSSYTTVVSSNSKGNPFPIDQIFSLDIGTFCETVIKNREPLLVVNALEDDRWKSAPETGVGMISYLGFPVAWPDGRIFGTICVLDDKANHYTDLYQELLSHCRDVLQSDLQTLTRFGTEIETQRAHLSELFARVPEAIVLVDHESRIVRTNPEFTRMFGYTAEEAFSQRIQDLIAPEDLQEEVENHMYRMVHTGEVFAVETARRHKDGTRVPVSLICVPVESNGNWDSGYAIYRDVTETKRLQDELKHERDRLQLLLNITNSMMSRLDLAQLVEALSRDLASVTKSDFCALMLPDSNSEHLRIATVYQSDPRGAIRKDMAVPIQGSMCGDALRTARSIRIDSIDETGCAVQVSENADNQDFNSRIRAEGLKSAQCVPLMSKGRVIGVLIAAKRIEHGSTAADEVFLEQLAHQVAIAVENALEYGRTTETLDREAEQKRYLQEEIRSERNFGKIIGASPGLKTVLEQVSVVAPTDSGVLILGETGTGKELIAREIHELSFRRGQAFVTLNCAAIPLGLLESELFGHERGAFTGAIAAKRGRFELANKGTLFLDEIGDIPLELQAKLLRVLQEQEFERLGSTRTLKVNVRIVAATHRDLAKMVAQQTFREDLYYRLKIFPVVIPPLRQRIDDIPLLARHFVGVYSRKMNKNIESIPDVVMNALLGYGWPGNVRELQNFVERGVILSPDSVLRAPISELAALDQTPQAPPPVNVLQQTEREQIFRALEQSNWVVGGRNGAAARLGLKRTSLVYRMQKLGIERGGSAAKSQGQT
jgi:formate hydrogenlyase transcriptional activator